MSPLDLVIITQSLQHMTTFQTITRRLDRVVNQKYIFVGNKLVPLSVMKLKVGFEGNYDNKFTASSLEGRPIHKNYLGAFNLL